MEYEREISSLSALRRRQLYHPAPVSLLPILVASIEEIIGRRIAPVDLIAAFEGERGAALHISGAVG